MVHALNEIRRVLVPDGLLLDLRPVLDHWHVEVASARETRETGRVQDFPMGLEDDEAANRAMAEAESNGWFKREREEFFPLYYSWDSASQIEEWIHDEWEDFIGLDDETKRATRSAWALSDGDSRVRVRVKMLITRWKAVK
jgi:SAM-dependent methyltransferase